MITCSSCKHEEPIGALFCSQCGAKLNYHKPTPSKTAVYTGNNQTTPAEVSPQPHPKSLGNTVLSLKVLESDVVIPLEGGAEFTLGRISGNQPILPDLDLTPYNAYEGGVSRLHASLKIEQGTITVTDLGSANGTRVNGRKLPPHASQSIQDGDILTLGKFKVQVLIRN